MPSFSLIVICSASTSTTSPSSFARTKCPVSLATFSSNPVPTNGASGSIKGTACLCIFEPIKARFASSFCKNGIKEVATDKHCSGETSIKSISSLLIMPGFPFFLPNTSLGIIFPSLSISVPAGAMLYCSSSKAFRY